MGPEMDHLFHREYRNFSISNIFRFGVFFDGLDDLANHLVRRYHDFDLKFFDNVNEECIRSVELLTAFLALKLIDFAYRHPRYSNLH